MLRYFFVVAYVDREIDDPDGTLLPAASNACERRSLTGGRGRSAKRRIRPPSSWSISPLPCVLIRRRRDRLRRGCRTAETLFKSECAHKAYGFGPRKRRLPPPGGKRRPCRDDGNGEFDRFYVSVRKADHDCNIELPPSTNAIMRRSSAYRGENSGPARMITENLTPRSGIREQNLPNSEVVLSPIAFTRLVRREWL
jgi:hypothetical protein